MIKHTRARNGPLAIMAALFVALVVVVVAVVIAPNIILANNAQQQYTSQTMANDAAAPPATEGQVNDVIFENNVATAGNALPICDTSGMSAINNMTANQTMDINNTEASNIIANNQNAPPAFMEVEYDAIFHGAATAAFVLNQNTTAPAITAANLIGKTSLENTTIALMAAPTTGGHDDSLLANNATTGFNLNANPLQAAHNKKGEYASATELAAGVSALVNG
jgi:hypothetical protein